MSRAERRQVANNLDGSEGAVDPKPDASPPPDGAVPTHFGVDGRPAIVVKIHYD